MNFDDLKADDKRNLETDWQAECEDKIWERFFALKAQHRDNSRRANEDIGSSESDWGKGEELNDQGISDRLARLKSRVFSQSGELFRVAAGAVVNAGGVIAANLQRAGNVVKSFTPLGGGLADGP